METANSRNFFSDRAWSKGVAPYLLLVLCCGALYLPGLATLPPTDRDESRFAQASRQMLESGNYVDIRFQDEPRYKKPIGIYWLQAAAVKLAGNVASYAIWPYRLPSVLGATTAVLLTFHYGRMLFGSTTALLGALLLSGSLLLTVEAHLAKTDAMMLAAIAAMQGALGKIYLQRRETRSSRAAALVFWGAAAAGVLLKGPIAPAIALLTVLTLRVTDRNWKLARDLHLVSGFLLFALLVLPWFVAINQATGGAFIKKAFVSDLLPKLIGGQESHGAPPGFYLLLFPLLFWPGSLFAVSALWPAWQQRSRHDGIRFCLAWAIPVWLMFELVPTKLPHYVMPAFPAIALVTAHFLLAEDRNWLAYLQRQPFRAIKWFCLLFWAAVTILLGAGIAVLPVIFERKFMAVSLLPVVAAILAISSAYLFWRQARLRRIMTMSLLGSFLLFTPAISVIMPALESLWLSRSITNAITTLAPQAQVVAVVGYSEPSLVFLLGTSRTRFTTPDEAVQLMQQGASSVAAVRSEELDRLSAAAELAGMRLQKIAAVRGYNYSKGKWLTMEIISGSNKKPDSHE